MKKFFALLAVVAMVGFVSCQEKDNPSSKAETATINASDVTVEEGATVQIVATTNSTAPFNYVMDNSGVATVDANGLVTGVKAGTGVISIRVAAIEGKFTAAEKKINVTVTAKAVPPTPAVEMAIDGDFSDWAALPAGSFSQTFGDSENGNALTKAKVYADANFIYVYFEWDTDLIEDTSWVPFHCYINTDGDKTTGGYADEFSDACSDLLLEGSIYDGGEICSYWAGAFGWIGEPNASGWGWMPDSDNLFPGEEVPTVGAGIEGKYELSIDRAMLNGVGYPVADVFSIGFDIQQNWETVGILPRESASEANPNGILPSLKVTTQK